MVSGHVYRCWSIMFSDLPDNIVFFILGPCRNPCWSVWRTQIPNFPVETSETFLSRYVAYLILDWTGSIAFPKWFLSSWLHQEHFPSNFLCFSDRESGAIYWLIAYPAARNVTYHTAYESAHFSGWVFVVGTCNWCLTQWLSYIDLIFSDFKNY